MNKEVKKEKLIKELKRGEKSGMVKDFNRDSFISNLHKKYANVKLYYAFFVVQSILVQIGH